MAGEGKAASLPPMPPLTLRPHHSAKQNGMKKNVLYGRRRKNIPQPGRRSGRKLPRPVHFHTGQIRPISERSPQLNQHRWNQNRGKLLRLLLQSLANLARAVVLVRLARERVPSRNGLLRCGDPLLCCPPTSFWERPRDVVSTGSCHDGICCKGQSSSPTPQRQSRSSLLRHELRDRAGRRRSVHPVVRQMAGRSRIR
jgi:hypothetical protein